MSESVLAGVEIQLGGQVFTLPPLNLDALEKYLPVIEGWATSPASLVQRLNEVAQVIHAGLLRNYPELPLAEVKQGLDLKNFDGLVAALLEASGLARTEPGEALAGSDPTGATSAPESAASPAGAGNMSADA